MGADERVFARQREAFPELVVPRWVEPNGGESLAQYGRRMARAVDPGGPCFVGGTSFGGFVAAEAARHLDVRGCFLIGSVQRPSELPRRIRILRGMARAAKGVPFEAISWAAKAAAELGGLASTAGTREMLRQVEDSDATFLRWAAWAVLTWDENPEPLRPPVWQIHGRRDRILPVTCTKADVVVEGAGHVLSVTHAAEVNRWLREGMQKSECGTQSAEG